MNKEEFAKGFLGAIRDAFHRSRQIVAEAMVLVILMESPFGKASMINNKAMPVLFVLYLIGMLSSTLFRKRGETK